MKYRTVLLMALLKRKHIQNEREQQMRQQIEGPEQSKCLEVWSR